MHICVWAEINQQSLIYNRLRSCSNLFPSKFSRRLAYSAWAKYSGYSLGSSCSEIFKNHIISSTLFPVQTIFF